jgi:hypothetical protein
MRGCIYITVAAGLVAQPGDIHLHRIDGDRIEHQAMLLQDGGEIAGRAILLY